MKLYCLLGSSLALLAVLPLASFAQENNRANTKPSPIESMAKDTVVQLYTNRDGSSNAFSGSGVLIGKEGNTYTVLSAAHTICEEQGTSAQQCLEASKIELTMPDGESFTASEVKEFSLQLDLILIKFQSPFKYAVAKLGESNQLKRGDPLFSAGFTTGEEWNFYNGKLIANSSKKLTMGGYDLFHDSKTIPGMSGGGVFNAKGELVCINSRGASNPALPTASCVPIAFYQEFNPQLEKTASELFLIAQNEYFQRNYKDAIEHLNQAIAKDLTFAEAYEMRGHCYYYLDKYKAAIKSYDRAIALQPKLAESHFWRGQAAFQLGDYSSALTSFQKNIEIQPKNILAIEWKARTLYSQEKYDLVIQNLTKEIDPENRSEYIYYLLGMSYEQIGLIDQALLSYDRAVEIGGANSDALPIRARIHMERNLYNEAIKDYDLLLTKAPSYSKVGYLWSRSTALLRVGDEDRVVADMDEIIKLDPKYKAAYLRKAETYFRIGQYNQSILAYSDVIDRFASVAINRIPVGSSTTSSSTSLPSIYGDIPGPLPSIPSISPINSTNRNTSNAAAYQGRALAYRQLKKSKNAVSDLKVAADLYHEDGKLEDETFCRNIIRDLTRRK
jgi:tetratricopeptide (TPR) repeat protein